MTPSLFNTWSNFFLDQHNYETSNCRLGNLIKSKYMRSRYGKYSITGNAVNSWNKIQKNLKSTLQTDLFPNNIKPAVSNYFL